MKVRTFLKYSVLVAGLLCGTALTVTAQPGGGGGMGGMGGGRGGILTQEQSAAIREAAGDTASFTEKLVAAQKEAVKAALAADASEASVRTKLDAVTKIQNDMAILRLKGIKALKLTAEQKTQMDGARDGGYGQLFGAGGGRGGMGGMGGGRGGN